MPHSCPVRWHELVGPYTDEARRLGCQHLRDSSVGFPDDGITCTSTWLYRRETFLDFLGNLVGGRHPPGVPDGFLGVQINTWKESHPGLRRVFSHAAPDPAPGAPGWNAWLTRILVAPLLERLPLGLPKAYPLRVPGDLALALERHYEHVGEAPGEVWRPASDPLEWRDAWYESQEEESEPDRREADA